MDNLDDFPSLGDNKLMIQEEEWEWDKSKTTNDKVVTKLIIREEEEKDRVISQVNKEGQQQEQQFLLNSQS